MGKIIDAARTIVDTMEELEAGQTAELQFARYLLRQGAAGPFVSYLIESGDHALNLDEFTLQYDRADGEAMQMVLLTITRKMGE